MSAMILLLDGGSSEAACTEGAAGQPASQSVVLGFRACKLAGKEHHRAPQHSKTYKHSE